MKKLIHKFKEIVSPDNLLSAWTEFVKGKRMKNDVQGFSLRLMSNILTLHHELVNGTYRHGGYHAFNISDPKPRNIHKASVRDRLAHHAIHRALSPFFERAFIVDSFSCRLGKGTHRALNRFRAFAYKVSHNNTRTCWVLKCDIRKFFASIDHEILRNILAKRIADTKLLELLHEVIGSFSSTRHGVGLPLGNLTSQLLVNIYMNEFDQFVKRALREKYYIRYADDFVIFSEERIILEALVSAIDSFLHEHLHLELHPLKVSIQTLASGVDFLGWVHFPDHRVLRTTTKRRMMKRIIARPSEATHASYLGLLSHGNAKKLEQKLWSAHHEVQSSVHP